MDVTLELFGQDMDSLLIPNMDTILKFKYKEKMPVSGPEPNGN